MTGIAGAVITNLLLQSIRLILILVNQGAATLGQHLVSYTFISSVLHPIFNRLQICHQIWLALCSYVTYSYHAEMRIMKTGGSREDVSTPVASKKKTRRVRQTTPGAAPSVQLLAEHVGDQSEMMDLLLDISS